MDILNSREWALLIWALIAICYLGQPSKRVKLKEPLVAVLCALFSRHLLSAFALMTMYAVAEIYTLAYLGLWDTTQVKGSLIWFFSVAAYSLFRVNDFSDAPHKLKGLVVDSFKLVVVIEYLVGAYTLHFVVEFVLVPVITFLSGSIAYAEGKPEYEPSYKFLKAVLGIVMTAVLGTVFYLLVADFQQIANRQAVMDFAVPVLLSTLYAPFIAFMALYSTYQTVLIRLKLSIKRRYVEIYARAVAMLLLNVRIELLKRWSTIVAKCQLHTISDVNNSIRQFFQMLAREKASEPISRSEGWPPYQAKNYLLAERIETGHYHPVDPMDASEWFSCSKLIEFGQGLIPNNIAYYLNGNERAVKSLKLKLNVNNPKYAEEAHAKLLSTADALARQALGLGLRETLSQVILPGKEGTLDGPDFKITFTKSIWPNHVSGGYDLGVEVSGV